MSQSDKEKVAEEIASRVADKMVLGVGTGSTVDCAIDKIGQKLRNDNLQLMAVTSSIESAELCRENGIIVLDFSFDGKIDFGFDGIDAIDPNLRAIKGKGAAMLREKILAVRCSHYTLIGDSSKYVENLNSACPVPVEIIPASEKTVTRELKGIGAKEVVLRKAKGKHGAVITEYGNVVLDVIFDEIPDTLETQIKSIVGVVESGLFLNYANEALIAKNGKIELLKRK